MVNSCCAHNCTARDVKDTQKANASNCDLGFRLVVSESTVSRVFTKRIEAIDILLSCSITWPDRESLRKTMPFCFRPHYSLRVTSIIDCFEILLRSPPVFWPNLALGHSISTIIQLSI